MGYDPMQYIPNTGAYIAQGADILSKMVSDIPGALLKDQEYQKIRKNYGDNKTFNQNLYNAASAHLGGKGITIRPPKEGESSDDYTKYVSEIAIPLIANGKIGLDDVNLLRGNAGVKDAAATASIISDYQKQDPMSAINLNPNHPQAANLQQQMPPQQVATPGMEGSFTEQAIATPSYGDSGISPNEIDPYDAMARLQIENAKRGTTPSADVFKNISDIKLAKLENENKKLEIEKERIRQETEKWKQNVVNASNTHKITDSSGKPLETLTNENAATAGIGPRLLPQVGPGGGGRGGANGDRDKPTASWTQYKDMEAQVHRLRSGYVDESGIKVPPNPSEAANAEIAAQVQFLAHNLEISGKPYDEAQSLALRVINNPVAFNQESRGEPILQTEKGWTLNLANPQVIQSLILAANSGQTAADVLAGLRKLKALNPSRQW